MINEHPLHLHRLETTQTRDFGGYGYSRGAATQLRCLLSSFEFEMVVARELFGMVFQLGIIVCLHYLY